MSLLRRRAPGAPLPERTEQQTFKHLLGTRVIEGDEIHRNVRKDESGNERRWYYQMRVLSASPISAVKRIWVNEEEVVLAASPQSAEDGFTAASSSSKFYKTFYVKFRLTGAETGVDPMHVKWGDEGANDETAPFAVAMILLSSGGPWGQTPPKIEFECDGAPLYDRRDGDQDPDDSLTWVFSDNPFVMADWYLQQRFGFAALADDVDATMLAAAADACDVLVSRGPLGGTEKRYTASLLVDEAEEPSAVLRALMQSCDGAFSEPRNGGKWGFYAGVWQAPVADIAITDIRDGERTWEPASLDEGARYTKVSGTFLEPSARYQATAFPPVTSVDVKAQEHKDLAAWLAANPSATDAQKQAEADKYRDLELEVEFDTVTSVTQAQRLASILLQRSRRGGRYTADFGLAAHALPIGARVTVTDPDFGLSALTFRVIESELQNLSEDPVVRLELQEDAEAVYTAPTLKALSGTATATPILPRFRAGAFSEITGVNLTDTGTQIVVRPDYAVTTGEPFLLFQPIRVEIYLSVTSGLSDEEIIADAIAEGLFRTGTAFLGLVTPVLPETEYFYLIRPVDYGESPPEYGTAVRGSYTTGPTLDAEAGDGVTITGSTISARIGAGLATDGSGQTEVDTGDGLEIGGGGEVRVRTTSRLSIASGQIDVASEGIDGTRIAAAVAGAGLDKDGSGNLEVATGAGLTIGASAEVKMADMAEGTFKGRTSSGTGAPEDLTVAQAKTLLGISSASLALMKGDFRGDRTDATTFQGGFAHNFTGLTVGQAAQLFVRIKHADTDAEPEIRLGDADTSPLMVQPTIRHDSVTDRIVTITTQIFEVTATDMDFWVRPGDGSGTQKAYWLEVYLEQKPYAYVALPG